MTTSPPAEAVRSRLSDGEWHRMHPLTPLLRGGILLVLILGFVIANLRDRLLDIFLPGFGPGDDLPEDPLDFIFTRDLVLVVLLVVLGLVMVLIALFWVSWRFHTFRITGEDVEVRTGVVFRTQRRAPLDRVQGVNLIRPLVARLVGLAKLEVVGAGLDANVRLEYLSTANAEAVRDDILRLASGRALGDAAPDAATVESWRSEAAHTLSRGVTGLVEGVETPGEPASVVRIPPGRLVGSMLLSESTVIAVLVAIGLGVWAALGATWVLVALVPTAIGVGAYAVRTLTRSLRYAIAPTEHGVRVVFGLFTTVTEILPPGRVHAVQVSQPLLWRPAGWWTVTVNRVSGAAAAQTAGDTAARVLPVGTRADAERVIALLLPWLDDAERALVFDRGLLATTDDPFTTTPRVRRFVRPVSWRRNGYALTDAALFLRRGRIWRSIAVVPLARMQSIAVHQGPIDRMLGLAAVQAHTVGGSVATRIDALGQPDAEHLFTAAEEHAVRVAALDRSHRWYVAAEPPEDSVPSAPAWPDPARPAPDVRAEPPRPARSPGERA